jgi:hypothetical protein
LAPAPTAFFAACSPLLCALFVFPEEELGAGGEPGGGAAVLVFEPPGVVWASLPPLACDDPAVCVTPPGPVAGIAPSGGGRTSGRDNVGVPGGEVAVVVGGVPVAVA